MPAAQRDGAAISPPRASRPSTARSCPEDLDFTDAPACGSARAGGRSTRSALYVPGGTAAYPSSVLMNAVPAKVAGVERIVMVVPTPDGVLNPLVAGGRRLAGVDEIYRIGGAQAVAALAYGTATIAPVDKIVGPGNAYVAAAKRRVFGTVGIDMIAGPSEILVVADRQNDPAWIAADLLSQAEHDAASQSILITDDRGFADAVVRRRRRASRDPAARGRSPARAGATMAPSSWCATSARRRRIVDRIAPEHVELAIERSRPAFCRAKIRHAGAIFLGRYTPEAIGDYVAGPNHVLPTSRSGALLLGRPRRRSTS